MTVRSHMTVLSFLALIAAHGRAYSQEPATNPPPAPSSAAATNPPLPSPASTSNPRTVGDLTRPAAVNAGLAPRSEQANAPETPTGKPVRDLSRLLGLEDSRWQLYGWIQNSYTATPGFNPRNRSTVTVFPNRLANEWQGNQYYLIIERALGTTNEWDYGLRLDTLFGNDWMFTHSFGLFNNVFTPLGFVGVDFPQMYAEVHLPFLFEGGIDLRGGRFYSPGGFESVMAVKRPLLSVPYLLNYTPFTFLGALATFHVSKQATISSGLVNGGDRWIDSNYHYGYLGGFNWTSESGKTTFTSTLFVGPNQLPFFPSANIALVDSYPVGVYTSPELQGRRNPYYNRSTFVYSSNVLVRQWTDKFTEAAEVAIVTEGNVLGLGPRGRPIRGTYYGFCHHFLYQFHDKITGVFRAEIFRDGNGLATGFDDTFNELTLGAILKPRPNLWVRPEIRYDWAQFTHPYDDGTRGGQLTLAFDVILQF